MYHHFLHENDHNSGNSISANPHLPPKSLGPNHTSTNQAVCPDRNVCNGISTSWNRDGPPSLGKDLKWFRCMCVCLWYLSGRPSSLKWHENSQESQSSRGWKLPEVSADLTYVSVGIFEAHTNLDRVSSLRNKSQIWIMGYVGSFPQAVVRAYDLYTFQLIYSWMCLYNHKQNYVYIYNYIIKYISVLCIIIYDILYVCLYYIYIRESLYSNMVHAIILWLCLLYTVFLDTLYQSCTAPAEILTDFASSSASSAARRRSWRWA